MAKTYEDLIVWQKAHDLVLDIYKSTTHFPSEEKFGLTSQIRRASVSVSSNIVEGFYRNGYKDAQNFLNISQSSLKELTYQTKLAFDLGYLSENNHKRLKGKQTETAKLLKGFSQGYFNRTKAL